MTSRAISFALIAVALAGCGGLSAAGAPPPVPTPTPPPARTPIQHIVIIIQENRTFDNFFHHFPNADSADSGMTHTGRVVALRPVDLGNPNSICHEHDCFVPTYDGGKLDGFDLNHPAGTPPTFPYSYVPESQIQPYWSLASTFTLADRFFQANSGPSYPAHQYLVAAQSQNADENPDTSGIWGCDSPAGTTVRMLARDGREVEGPFPCFDYRTVTDEMDGAGVTWHYYAAQLGVGGGVWSALDAVRHVRFGPDWTRKVIEPSSRILTDVAGGSLAQVTWVTPSAADSDHPGDGADGPQWVATVVNAIGESPFWKNTAIFILWDDWGGWYEHVPPPQLDVMGLGYRVPLIIVSPYARPRYVSHVQHEFGSILKFTEEDFGIPALGAEDSRADDLSDCFDFSQSPLHFDALPTSLPPSHFIGEPPSSTPPDED